MFARSTRILSLALLLTGVGLVAWAQTPSRFTPIQPRPVTTTAPVTIAPGWRPSGTAATTPATNAPAAVAAAPAAPADTRTATRPATSLAPAGATTSAAAPLQPVTPVARTPIAKVTSGSGTLPNDKGQVWREYDISPYTLRVTSTNKPEQAIVDWVLRETGYEAWHGEPVSLLSADKRTLRVYHTPQMQAVVGEIVDRFVNSEAESHAFGMRIISMANPNWRAKAQRMLKPVSVQSQGVQAWLLAKEDAALIIAEMRKRTDFREHSSPHLLVNNGQTTVVSATRPKNYIKNVNLRGDTWPGFEPQVGQLDEGFSIEFNPLLSLDARSIDAIIKCNVDQVEKLVPVTLDVPTSVAPRQRTTVDVPQLSSSRLHERFHWPTDHVLLISAGVVATPTPTETVGMRMPGTAPARADLLVFIESRGKAAAASTANPAARTGSLPAGQTYRGRY